VAKRRAAIVTVGCRSNQSDSAWLARDLDARGFEVVAGGEPADVYIINSCAVTSSAERDVRRAIHRARRLSGDDAKILLTGCMVTAVPESVESLGPLWALVSSVERRGIAALLSRRLASSGGQDSAWEGGEEPSSKASVPAAIRRARPSLRVQDGCEHRCSYCAVPAGRGPYRSTPPSEVLERLEMLAAEGAREVVICGINLGAWGRDLSPRLGLLDLVELLEEAAPVERVRLSSIEPWAIDEAIVELLASCRRIAPHLHLPLQSGDDALLRRMRRPYTARRFADLVDALLVARPGMAVGTDVIAGFPGEDDGAFEQTRELVASLPLAYLHAFGFSPRPATEAATLQGRVPRETIRQRVATLRAISLDKRALFARTMIDRVVHPLFESRRAGSGELKGVTGRFLGALVEGPDEYVNRIAPVVVQAVTDDGRLVGRLLDVD